MKIAVAGASGKTGYRIAEEALKNGHQPILILRENSKVPQSLENCTQKIVSLSDGDCLDDALRGADVLIIATGARPSIDLTGPARIDAIGVQNQIKSCQRVNLKRVILVSSLCTGRWLHPLNLFGLILIWKRIGEKALENSGLDWTVIRPGGLTEQEEGLGDEKVFYTSEDKQEEAYIPRRLVAKCCIEALSTPSSIGRIIEVTSNKEINSINMEKAIQSF